MIIAKNDARNNTIKASIDLYKSNPEIDLYNALHTKGYAVLENHTVPLQLVDDVITQWHKFFISKDKYRYLRTDETDEGFIPINFETATMNDVADFKELYQTHFNGVYPSQVDTGSTLQLFSAMVRLAEQINQLLELSIPIPMTQRFSNMISGSNNHLLRIIHYPPTDKHLKIPRAAAHTDICLFTMVLGCTFNGLEFQDNNGTWYEPELTNTSIVIFNSEMIDLITNGQLKAVMHRVKATPNGSSESRFSMPVAIHPLRELELIKGLTAGEHLKNRLNEMGYNGNVFDTKNY